MAAAKSKPTILVLSQVYVPDPASVGQHMADAAEELARRGFTVRVLTSGRGYDDPSVRYAPRETLNGVEVVRLPFSWFGKKTILHRMLGSGPFLLQTIIQGIFTRRLTRILVTTTPPTCPVAALVISWIRRVPIKYWVMDINPDQLIALGRITEKSLPSRVFNWLNRRILSRADDIIVMDRFMADRIAGKLDIRHKLSIVAPWPLDENLSPVPRDQNPFVSQHGLQEKFVIMYSGNHSIASPLTTLIEAALQLQDETRLHFMFIGGGLGKQEVTDAIERYQPRNFTSLPYQPLSKIKYSLSAADIHVVALGGNMVGIIHPCKLYGAMSIGRPILMLGPSPSHVSDLLEQYPIGWQIDHGQTDAAVATLRTIAETPRSDLEAMGKTAQEVVEQELSKDRLCAKFCDIIERGV